MRTNRRSILAVIGVALLLIQMTSGLALAGESSSSPAVQIQPLAPSEITLEKAILIVKNKFDIPNEYTDFNSTYNTNDDRQVWSLRWNGPVGRPGEFSAEVSALNGDILSMNNWKSGILLQLEAATALFRALGWRSQFFVFESLSLMCEMLLFYSRK